jgi:alpha-glucosidase (family GH31 glycosyl hydrolase)
MKRSKIQLHRNTAESILLLTLSLLFPAFQVVGQPGGSRIETAVLPGENWWGGNMVDGRKMPFGEGTYQLDQYGNIGTNHAQPFFLSDRGRFIWSEEPLKISFSGGRITAESADRIVLNEEGKTLREAFTRACSTYFPPSGGIPHPLFFSSPQYNTWIELQYDQNEDDVLKYAASIIGHGFPPGIIMIDDNWQKNYGEWEFSCERFDDPGGMVELLHTMGFKVMLWVCPFVTSSTPTYRELARGKKLMFAGPDKNQPAIVRWWNGQSALLDLSNPEGMAWYREQLQHLMDAYAVDGFKLDAGDAIFYRGIYGQQDISPNAHAELHASVGPDLAFNEYRASWKMGGQPLVQRLRDKRHSWDDLAALIPDMIALGLIGHPFSCPDMIGGGEVGSFWDNPDLDEELIIRSTQVSALMPMMQFSVAPWRVLGPENLVICRNMAKLHDDMGDEILALAHSSAITGEPIIRSLEYVFPGQGYALIRDQFLLGDEILVAPVLNRGQREREVVFPKGRWKGDDGSVVEGPSVKMIVAPLDRLPWYRKISE